jgi:WD40 repeat protein
VVWDVKTGKEVRTLTTVGTSTPLALSVNGRYIAAKLATNSVRILGVTSGQELRQFDVPNVYGPILAFSRDNKQLATSQGNTINLFDLEKSRPLHEVVGHSSNVDGVRFTADGKGLASFSRDGSVIWWDLATARPMANWTGTGASSFRLAPDGRSCYYSMYNGLKRVELSDDKPAERVVLSDGNNYLPCMAVSADNKVVVVRSKDQLMHFHNVSDGKDLGKLPTEASRYAYYALSPDGKQLVGAAGRLIYFWDAPSATAARQYDLAGKDPNSFANATGLQYSPDGRSLLTTTAQGVTMWETVVGRERWRGPQAVTALFSSAFSRDGRLAAVGNSTGTVFVLDTATGAQLAELPGHRGPVRTLDFSTDGKRLASGSEDGTILVWDTAELSKKVRPEPVKLTEEQLGDLARELGNLDSPKAHKAVRALADSPQAAAYLQANIKSVEKFDEAHAKKLIIQLDDEDFDVRDKAEKDLESMGTAVLPLLREALKEKPSVEVKTRIERLLEPFKDQQVPNARLRAVRAVEVLEFAGTEEAVKALKALAGGDAKDPLAQDAKAALERLESRAAKP